MIYDKKLLDYINFCKSKGLKIDTVYDIGAYMGNWSINFKNNALPEAEFILFEANSIFNDRLESIGFQTFNVLLSNPGREYVEFYNGADSGDSYYKENTTHYNNKTSIKLPCFTLNEIIKTYNLPYPNFIKLDTQGSEIDILNGASDIIDFVDLIAIECPIMEYNSNSPNFYDYLKYFKEHNFLPVQITEEHMSEDILIQLDMVFMKKETKDRILSPTTTLKI